MEFFIPKLNVLNILSFNYNNMNNRNLILEPFSCIMRIILLEYKSINLYEQIKKFYQITFNNTILPWDEGMYVVKINTFQEILSKIDTDILYIHRHTK